MRVNVDGKALTDPRIARAAARLGMHVREVLGRLIAVWMQAYENRSPTMKAIDVDQLAEHAGFANVLVSAEVDLAHKRGKSVRLRGVDERIAFLLIQDAKRAKALAARLNHARTPESLPGDLPPGKYTDEKARITAGFPGDVPGDGPYSPDPAPAASQDRAQAPTPEKRSRSKALSPSSRSAPLPDRFERPEGGKALKAEQELEARGGDAQHSFDKFVRFQRENDGRSANWYSTLTRWYERERVDEAEDKPRPTPKSPSPSPKKPKKPKRTVAGELVVDVVPPTTLVGPLAPSGIRQQQRHGKWDVFDRFSDGGGDDIPVYVCSVDADGVEIESETRSMREFWEDSARNLVRIRAMKNGAA